MFLRSILLSVLLTSPLALASAPTDVSIDFEAEVPAEVKTRVLADIDFVRAIPLAKSSPLHTRIFGAVEGDTYLKWFAQRIWRFGYNPEERSGAIAYNDSQLAMGRMVVTDYFVKGNLPMMARVDVLFHEARHSEAKEGYWSHLYCPTPFLDANGKDIVSEMSGIKLEGKPACDDGVMGAYGVGAIMLGNLGVVCGSCTAKVKLDAELYAKDSRRRFLDAADKAKVEADRDTLLKN